MNFLNIETLFAGPNDRTIERLSKLYYSRDLLREKIKKVGKGFLDSKSVLQGKKILLKPNWVVHNRKEDDEICLRTNDNFLLAAIELILENKPASILIGDAPIQGCDWDKMLSKEFKDSIKDLSEQYSVPIEVKDFRRVTFDPSKNNPETDRKPIEDYVIFDLGKSSLLEPISSKKNNFRVTSYNPDRLAESHSIGKHKYCITKELFEADIIISLPKIKTHQKSGITGALKNIVGLNGDKDYLPHHRVGGTELGGDCYPGNSLVRRLSEFFMDRANRKQGSIQYWFWFKSSLILWRLSRAQYVHNMDAGWHGNDTTWRMVVDLNSIIIFGKADGTIAGVPERILYSLSDGIVGGQGDGPLNPIPLPLGIISFSNCSELNDTCMAILMNFDINKIPLIAYANKMIKSKMNSIILNGKEMSLENLKKISIITQPPAGWKGYL